MGQHKANGADLTPLLQHLNVDLGTLLQTADIQLDADGALHIVLKTDNIGLAKADQLPSSLTGAGNLKQSIEEQSIAAGVDLQAHYATLIELHASGAETADGNSGDIDVSQILYLKACVDVTSVSGTNPTLDIYLEGKDEESGKYETLWNPAQITGTTTVFSGVLTIPHQNIRLRWVIGGTSPSFTFSGGANCKV